jgi:hypothetical protein
MEKVTDGESDFYRRRIKALGLGATRPAALERQHDVGAHEWWPCVGVVVSLGGLGRALKRAGWRQQLGMIQN